MWRGTSTAWGRSQHESVHAEWDVPQNLRFQGQYLDRETGLHYNTFRYYDPTGGCYTQMDPIGLQGGLNTYTYVVDPLGWMDPLGLIVEWVNPSTLNYSQAYISDNVEAYINDMKTGNWDWERSGPLNVAEIDGQLVSLDNRRLYAAQMAGVDSVPINKVNLSDPLPKPATGGTYGSNLDKKLNSKPKNSNVPKVKLPKTGSPNKPQIVSRRTGGIC